MKRTPSRFWSRQFLAAFAILALIVGARQAAAAVLLSDFSDFNLTGTYEQWNGATFTSGPTDFRVQSPSDFGGGWYDLPAPVDASGNSLLELGLNVNPANVATLMNIVLIDGDGTERVYRFDGFAVGDDQTLTKGLGDFLQDNNPGTTPGFDLSSIRTFHLQGTFANGNPGLAMDLTFDNLALVVPEPASLALGAFAVACLLGFARRSR